MCTWCDDFEKKNCLEMSLICGQEPLSQQYPLRPEGGARARPGAPTLSSLHANAKELIQVK